MRKKHRVLSFLTAVVLFAGLSLPTPVLAANLYFTAVNDTVSPLTSDSMPFWSGGMLYVPYTVFDANLNGIGVSLGLYTSYNRGNNTITLFNLRQMLIFDLNNGTCWDDTTGTSYSSRAILRNGKPYLSLNMVCGFFGLEYSCSQLPYVSQGYLVRIKSADAVNDDASFIDAARNVINNRLRDYTQSLSPADTTSPSADPGTSPSPPSGTDPGTAPGKDPGTDPGNTGPAAPNTRPDPDDADTAAYLAFRCESGEGLSGILNALDSQGAYALFFLTPELLEEEGGLVRRILGSGHSVGILADGGEETEALLARGSRALEAAAQTRTTLAYVPSDRRAALEEAGWICWRETALLQPDGSASPNTYAANAVKRLGDRDDTVYLTLEGGDDTARVLSALLRYLSNENFIVSIPLETRL